MDSKEGFISKVVCSYKVSVYWGVLKLKSHSSSNDIRMIFQPFFRLFNLYPPVNEHSWLENEPGLSRCISYWKWGCHSSHFYVIVYQAGYPQRWGSFIWMFPRIIGGPPKSSILIGFSLFSPSILGAHPYIWKHPYIYIYIPSRSLT